MDCIVTFCGERRVYHGIESIELKEDLYRSVVVLLFQNGCIIAFELNSDTTFTLMLGGDIE